MEVLSGEHVRLEPLGHEHVEALCAAAAEDRSTYRFTWVPDSREAMARYVSEALAERDAGSAVPLVTVRLADGRVVGSTRFLNLRRWGWPDRAGLPDVAEVGATWLAASAQRTAVNTEAKLLQLSHAFEVWGVQRLELKTDARNERSRRAIERLGARFEAVLRAYQPSAEGQWPRDTAMYAILTGEWPQVRARLLSRLGRSEGSPGRQTPTTP